MAREQVTALAAFALVASGLLLANVSRALLARRLRLHDPALYVRLGSPPAVPGFVGLWGFLYHGRWAGVDDTAVRLCAVSALLGDLMSYGVIATAFVVMLGSSLLR